MTKPLTPMMRQYHEIRRGLPADALLLFRLGDFYEIFLEDAERGAALLGITLTHRHGMPMAGIPYHAADNYIQKLLDQNVKVAICDQVETPRPGKLVKRELTRIITPGTRLEETQIDARQNHFLLALSRERGALHAAWVDLTTGEFRLASDSEPERLFAMLATLNAREVLLPEAASKGWRESADASAFVAGLDQICAGRAVTALPDYHFDHTTGFQTVTETLGVLNLDGFGVARDCRALGAAGAALSYATDTLCAKPENIRSLREYRAGQALLVDPSTLRNLEIFRTAANSRTGSLLDAMDATLTAPGARMLERWLSAPLLDPKEIERRQQCVGEFVHAPGLASELRQHLRAVRDLERILGRLQNRLRNPRELGGVRDTLRQLPAISQLLHEFPQTPVARIADRIHSFDTLSETLERALADDLPGNLQDGGAIRNGFDPELDRLRGLASDSKTWISELEQAEQARSGIKNLKIRYTGAFGYAIEVTKSNLHLVPEDYVRKQTMKNAERYTTPDLKEREKAILRAEEEAQVREQSLFAELVDTVLEHADPLRESADALAELDVLIGWGVLARDWDYCKPQVDESDRLWIDQGRHPVVEQRMRADTTRVAGMHAFVPNDTRLSAGGDDQGGPQIALITGPNMAGKSTFIRQVALIVLMAQTGAWVPARECRVGMVDRIFSRVGASDDLARGNSTFMVEMNETANILNNATAQSLVILDEIGRGTSTYDGLSIAWSVVEHLHDATGTDAPATSGPRTLFATHYHELTQLAERLPRLANYTVAVKEWNDEIIFVRQVVPGAADRSYGIHVARLAGLPDTVIARAQELLERLEADDASHNLLKRRMRKERSGDDTRDLDDQLSLF